MTDTQVGKGVAQALADFQAAHKLTLENIALRQQLAESKALSAYRGQQLAEKDAEIERLNKNLLWSMQCTAESEAREVKLREALEAVSTAKERGFCIGYAKGYVDKILVLPADDTALREMIAKAGEVMRLRCERESWLMTPVIRTLPGVTLEDLK